MTRRQESRLRHIDNDDEGEPDESPANAFVVMLESAGESSVRKVLTGEDVLPGISQAVKRSFGENFYGYFEKHFSYLVCRAKRVEALEKTVGHPPVCKLVARMRGWRLTKTVDDAGSQQMIDLSQALGSTNQTYTFCTARLGLFPRVSTGHLPRLLLGLEIRQRASNPDVYLCIVRLQTIAP